MITQEYDAVLITEELITSKEFLKRREEGNISHDKVEIALPSSALPFGGFRVKLDTPYYKVSFDEEIKRVR